jgi:hypothetical protein
VLWVAYATHSTLRQIPDAVDAVVCAPDDGWKYHPKHIEQFPDIKKLCDVTSCWIYTYIGILLGAHPIFRFSRIRVNDIKSIQQKLKVKNTQILIRPVVTYGCESRKVRIRDEQHLRIFESRILRKIWSSTK